MYVLATSDRLGPGSRGPPPTSADMPERSCCSNRLPTDQPLLISPTRSSFLAIALSKNVSQNGDVPLIRRIGFTVTPGWFIVSSTKLMPSCLGTSGFVRTSANIQSAYWAPDVQIFCPLIRE